MSIRRIFTCIGSSTYGNSGPITQSSTRENRVDSQTHGIAIRCPLQDKLVR